ncbi:hypothetical protein ACFFX0_06990 [Citricoccus parietis]|uniref:Uncharacterized protein n=1 Tax=Citricoccus parietis TaxID=592307 RepID=A0ABV5FWB1_9MICC
MRGRHPGAAPCADPETTKASVLNADGGLADGRIRRPIGRLVPFRGHPTGDPATRSAEADVLLTRVGEGLHFDG